MKVHIFRCSDNENRYAFSNSKNGSNVPINKDCELWGYFKEITIELGDKILLGGVDPNKIIPIIEKEGYVIIDTGIIIKPII